MTVPPPDGSRDRRIEDPTNLWLIHPAARALLAPALRAGVSANAVSFAGLALGLGAAACYSHWESRLAVLAGLILSAGWLVADGLDGMVARATGTASPLGRFLDGIVDHGVFFLIYVSLAASIGTVAGWALAIAAGCCHAVQSALYEGERARFHRRARGLADTSSHVPLPGGNLLVRLYDRVATLPARSALPFEWFLAARTDPRAFAARYARRAVGAMRVESLLSANMRVWLIALACLLANPRLFWWAEIVPLSLVAALGLVLHRRVERGILVTTTAIGHGHLPAAPATRDL